MTTHLSYPHFSAFGLVVMMFTLKMALLYILIPFVTVRLILKMVTHVTRLKTKTAVTFEMPSHLSAPLCPVPLLGHPCRNWLFRKHRKTCRHLVSFDLQDRGFFRLANWLYCLLVVALTNVLCSRKYKSVNQFASQLNI